MSLSETLFQQAKQHIPGGVNSPVRAFNGVGGSPLFFEKGQGAYLTDVDGRRYIDYVGSWGPMILGHAHPEVIDAVLQTAKQGLSFGAPTPLEIALAEKISELMPNLPFVRMVNSGTEATMTAIRLARGYTGRDKIIKFEGCYHGHSDSLLVNAGSGALTLGVPSSPGVPESIAEHTLTANFNDLNSVKALFERYEHQIAAIIVEPIPGNMGCILPQAGFLSGLRSLCDQHETILIFDEVMSGFRVALGGAQAIYDVVPDLTTLGKVIGGGLPVGAVGGREAVMSHLAPLGPVYQAGTLSGNPIAMRAGLATLTQISQPNFFEDLAHRCQTLITGIKALAKENNISLSCNNVGGMFGLFFTDDKTVTCYQQVVDCRISDFQKFYHMMLAQGIYLAPSAFEAGFISSAHGEEEIALTLKAFQHVFEAM